MVMAIIFGVLALGLGTPTVLHLREQRAKAEALRTAKGEAEEAARKVQAAADAKAAAEAATKEREEAEAAFRADPESHVIPNLREALDASVHPIQDDMEAADRALEASNAELATAEAKVEALEKDMPEWLQKPAGEMKVNIALGLAPFVFLAVLALDYTMFASTYGSWQAVLYTVVTVVVSTFVGLTAVTAIPRLLRLPEEPTERFRARLTAGAAISGLVIVIAGLLWLAPNRSEANNANRIATAEQALADAEAENASSETLALRTAAVKSAHDRAELDRTIDQAMVLAMFGADLLVAEGALLALSGVRPRQRAKLAVEDIRNDIGALGEQRARLGADHRAAARQVGTRVWNYLQMMNVPQPEVVIRDAMSRIAAADPVHYQVIQQGVERYRELTPPTPGDVVVGEVVGAGAAKPTAPAAPATPAKETTAPSTVDVPEDGGTTVDGPHDIADDILNPHAAPAEPPAGPTFTTLGSTTALDPGAIIDEPPMPLPDDTVDPMPDVDDLEALVAL